MKILIIGGSSSVSMSLKPVLLKFAEVYTAGRNGCDITIDLSNDDDLIFDDDIDVVINCAASFCRESYSDLLMATKVNALALLKICSACTKAKINHIIQISTHAACLEDSSPYYSGYSLSKKQGDELCNLYCNKFGLPLTILRPSDIYGVQGKIHVPHLYYTIDKVIRNEDINIYGSVDALRNYIHIDDVVNIISQVVKLKVYGTHTVMNTEYVSFSEIAKEAILAFSSKSKIKFLTDRPNIHDDIYNCRPDLFFYKEINYYPKITMKLGMQKEALKLLANLHSNYLLPTTDIKR